MSSTQTARAIAASVNAGASARTAVDAALARAGADTTNAIIRVHGARAQAAAAAVDARVKAGERLPLAGVPIAIKDNLCLAGRRGHRLLEDPQGLHRALHRDRGGAPRGAPARWWWRPPTWTSSPSARRTRPAPTGR